MTGENVQQLVGSQYQENIDFILQRCAEENIVPMLDSRASRFCYFCQGKIDGRPYLVTLHNNDGTQENYSAHMGLSCQTLPFIRETQSKMFLNAAE